MKAFLLSLLLLAPPALAEDAHVTALMNKGEAAARQRDWRGALALFRQAENGEPGNVRVLLRISRLCTDLIDVTKPEDAAHKVAEQALDYARRALALDPHSAKAHLSVGVCYGRLTDFVGNKTKLEYSKIVKSESEKSLALDASDDFAWHVLGRWHLGVANVSGMLKTLARLIYGGLPPASNEEALRCLKKAAELAPRRIMHHAELAHVHEAMGRRDLALQEWQRVLGLRAADPEDADYLKEARAAVDARLPRSGDLQSPNPPLRALSQPRLAPHASATQPASRHTPPIGVIAPSTFTSVSARA